MIESQARLGPTFEPIVFLNPGEGIGHDELLGDKDAWTTVVTSDESDIHKYVIIGGDKENDGMTRGNRPPLLIPQSNIGLVNARYFTNYVSILPYSTESLKNTGLAVGEDFHLTHGDHIHNMGNVVTMSHYDMTLATKNLDPPLNPVHLQTLSSLERLEEEFVEHIDGFYRSPSSRRFAPKMIFG